MTLALPVAIGIVLAARFVAAPLRAVPDYDNSDFSRFVAAEKYEFRGGEGTPAVLLLGSSRTQYAFEKASLASVLGVPPESVRNLSVPAGSPWASATMLRRNLGLLDGVRFILVDVAPVQFNGGRLPLKNRFAHLAGLAERTRIDARPAFRAEQTADWFSGHLGIRRSLKSYGMAAANARRGVIWGADDRELLDPAWVREDDHEKIKREMFAENFNWRPENFPAATFENYHQSKFLQDALLEIEAIAAAAGVHLVIHQPPFHPVFLETIQKNPAWRDHYSEYRSFLESRKSANVTVLIWDLPSELGIPTDALLDYGHYGRAAAELYSKRIGELITRDGNELSGRN